MNQRLSLLSQSFLLTIMISCASQPSDSKKEENKDQVSSKDSSDTKKKQLTTGPSRTVTTTLQNDLTFMFFLPPDIAAKTQDSIGFKKEIENVPLSITYLSASRLSRQPLDQKIFQKIALAGGSQSPWFLLEYAYIAILKKDYLLAEYIIGKAKKNSKDENSLNACSHALGLKLISEGETYLGILELQRAKSYYPSLLTLGFMAVRSGDGASGERYLRTALGQGENPLVRVGLASALRLQGKNTEAQEALTPVYKSKEKDKRIVWNYGLILSQNPASVAEAKTTLEKYYTLSGSTPELDASVQKTLNQLKTPPPKPLDPKDKTVPGKPADPADSAKEGSPAPAAKSTDPKSPAAAGKPESKGTGKSDVTDPAAKDTSTKDPKNSDQPPAKVSTDPKSNNPVKSDSGTNAPSSTPAKTDNKESNKNPTSSPGTKPDTLKTESKSDKPAPVKEADSES